MFSQYNLFATTCIYVHDARLQSADGCLALFVYSVWSWGFTSDYDITCFRRRQIDFGNEGALLAICINMLYAYLGYVQAFCWAGYDCGDTSSMEEWKAGPQVVPYCWCAVWGLGFGLRRVVVLLALRRARRVSHRWRCFVSRPSRIC